MAKLGGICTLDINSLVVPLKGEVSVVLGVPMKESIVGVDGSIHGYKEETRVSSIEGTISLKADVDWEAIQNTKNANVVLRMPNGRTFLLSNAHFAGEGGMTTEESEMEVRFEGEGEYL